MRKNEVKITRCEKGEIHNLSRTLDVKKLFFLIYEQKSNKLNVPIIC